MYYLGVDTGGTFTDFVALNAKTGELITFKVASVPSDPAQAVKNAVQGPITPEVPASILQSSEATTLYLDQAAAALLN